MKFCANSGAGISKKCARSWVESRNISRDCPQKRADGRASATGKDNIVSQKKIKRVELTAKHAQLYNSLMLSIYREIQINPASTIKYMIEKYKVQNAVLFEVFKIMKHFGIIKVEK